MDIKSTSPRHQVASVSAQTCLLDVFIIEILVPK
jgi:hypothetical protein